MLEIIDSIGASVCIVIGFYYGARFAYEWAHAFFIAGQ